MSKRRVLTGITTSGAPHLGNYVGAIRPAVEASQSGDYDSFFFLADYHSLIKCQDPGIVHQSTLEIAAAWLALGLDPNKVTFYRQSDIPEIPELTWLLTCMTAKGLVNRAHAYKGAVQLNEENGDDADFGVTMGLFSYPILMAADILMFNAHKIPVGRDQIQHIEMARDIAQRFNHHYGKHFVLPEAQVDDDVAVLQGLDGRKMSKSYDNYINIFLPDKQLRKVVMKVETDSTPLEEPKNPDTCHTFALYKLLASPAQTDEMKANYLGGNYGYGHAKQALFELILEKFSHERTRFDHLMANTAEIDAALSIGAQKARSVAQEVLKRTRTKVGY